MPNPVMCMVFCAYAYCFCTYNVLYRFHFIKPSFMLYLNIFYLTLHIWYIFRMKRRNRLTLRFLSPSIKPKKSKKFRICSETISVQQPVQRVDISNVSEADVPDYFSEYEGESGDSETAHTKRKLKLAENWMEIRDKVYRAMISTYALYDAECFLCGATATIRCTQCGPHLMCLCCCLQSHSMHNIHHYPELWKVKLSIISSFLLYLFF